VSSDVIKKPAFSGTRDRPVEHVQQQQCQQVRIGIGIERPLSLYRESLDGRRVSYHGVAVDDVTMYPVFAHAADHAALD
jgi:hypothetical protein